MDGTEYITLKEAGEISGYSPDYIGQLIRRGKIAGKQVYANVAWVTTRDALSEYLSEKGKARRDPVAEESLAVIPATVTEETSSSPSGDDVRSVDLRRWESFFRLASRTIIVIATVFLLFLFHVLSTLLDDSLERRALERVSLHAPTHHAP